MLRERPHPPGPSHASARARRRRPRTGAFVALVACIVPIALGARPTRAPAAPRTVVDFEAVTIHESLAGHKRRSLFVLGGTIALPTRGLLPYVGAGLGIYTAQARAGLLWLPSGLMSDGLVVRLEARPMAYLAPCLEPAVFGNLGVGYRWQLQESYSEDWASPALYVMPHFGGGEAWIRPKCEGTGSSDPRVATFMLGGSVALGLDF